MKRRERLENFLLRLDLLADLYLFEQGILCDVIENEVYEDGEAVITEGEHGDSLYFIESGEATAYKRNSFGTEEKVYEYKKTDYFGELALIRNKPRAATVRAKGLLKVCSIARGAFKRVLGPLEDLLKRNTSRYEAYMNK